MLFILLHYKGYISFLKYLAKMPIVNNNSTKKEIYVNNFRFSYAVCLNLNKWSKNINSFML